MGAIPQILNLRSYKMRYLIAFISALLFIGPALADNDGVNRLNSNDNAIPGVYVDLGVGSVDRNELSTGVKDELDGLRNDTNTNTTTIGEHTETLTVHQNTLTLHSTELASLSSENTVQNGRLEDLEYTSNFHTSRLNSIDRSLADHTRRLDEQAKGLAIAMAMPDTWLSDKDNFAIAGNFGGFGDEMAFGFAMIGRLDQNWSLNAKVGSDVDFEQFGWSIGARAGF